MVVRPSPTSASAFQPSWPPTRPRQLASGRVYRRGAKYPSVDVVSYPNWRPPTARLQFRLPVHRNVDENAFRAFSREPPVIRAWLAAPESVKRAGRATVASPATSELTTPFAISSAVSS